MTESSDFDMLTKVLILGDSAVGKTNLLFQACQGKFYDNHVATIGVDFKMKVLNVSGRKVKMQLWDTAGQERFKTMNTIYYKGATAIILVFSITDRPSFNAISNWVTQIKENTSEEVCLILAGNKCDLETERQISFAEGKSLAEQLSIPFLECSAKEGKNVEELFNLLAKDMIGKVGVGERVVNSNKNYEFTNLEEKTQYEKKSCGCY